MRLFALLFILFASQASFGQDSSSLDIAISFPTKFFKALDKKTSSIEQKIDKQTDRYLTKLQKREHKLRNKVTRKDSALAKQLFDGVNEKYSELKSISGGLDKYQNVYSGHLDSLSTALNFLKGKDLVNNPVLQQTLNKYKELQLKLNTSEQVKKYLVQRRELLKQQFQKMGMIKQLKKFRKEVFYYQAQVQEYRKMFEDPIKMEEKLLSVVTKVPQFQNFFAKNSMLASIFPLPGAGNGLNTASFTGLQTRASINQSLTSRFGNNVNLSQQLQQNRQSAQGQLNELKSKLSSLASGSYTNGEVDFSNNSKINSQKAKSFFKRIEVGTNIQTRSARNMFPITSDVGLSLNYKLNDQAFAGIGFSGGIGWGTGWSTLKISYQGIGGRSNIDWKVKNNFYVTGGYEMNYRSIIQSFDQLKDYSAWQSSGLIGVSKKYQISKKLKGDLKLMWDFLSQVQIPKTQPLLFRVGYAFR